jgi:hypothetical protein
VVCLLSDGQLLYVNLDEFMDEEDGSKLDLEKLSYAVGVRIEAAPLDNRDLDALKDKIIGSAVQDMSSSSSSENVFKRNKQPSMPYRIGRK